jgi:FkbM family methyltransferase
MRPRPNGAALNMTVSDKRVRAGGLAAGFKTVTSGWHKILSRSRPVSKGYFVLVSALSRTILADRSAARVESILTDQRIQWPRIDFGPRTTMGGRGTWFKLRPHLGEFDQAALFTKKLRYEEPVFAWLEENAASMYDAVIEIGANVGVYSVFLDAIIGANPGARLKQVISFEPALEPFTRLTDNLRANQTRFVTPYRVAIADETGMRAFFEPSGHLTNGSLDCRFASIFSTIVREDMVIALSPQELRPMFEQNTRVLVKVDVEGYEPSLMRAFGSVIEEFHPDFLIEILEGTPEAIESLGWLDNYERYLITPEGLDRRHRLAADRRNRDWFLKANVF